MKKIILTFPSVTYAVKSRRLLERESIPSRLIKTETLLKQSGCVHGLEISYSDFLKAIGVLKENDIEYKAHDV